MNKTLWFSLEILPALVFPQRICDTLSMPRAASTRFLLGGKWQGKHIGLQQVSMLDAATTGSSFASCFNMNTRMPKWLITARLLRVQSDRTTLMRLRRLHQCQSHAGKTDAESQKPPGPSPCSKASMIQTHPNARRSSWKTTCAENGLDTRQPMMTLKWHMSVALSPHAIDGDLGKLLDFTNLK